jgi:hypothetical protein
MYDDPSQAWTKNYDFKRFGMEIKLSPAPGLPDLTDTYDYIAEQCRLHKEEQNRRMEECILGISVLTADEPTANGTIYPKEVLADVFGQVDPDKEYSTKFESAPVNRTFGGYAAFPTSYTLQDMIDERCTVRAVSVRPLLPRDVEHSLKSCYDRIAGIFKPEYKPLLDEIKFNGSTITDVIRADDKTGEIHYYQRHWSTGDLIPDGDDPTGFATCKDKGSVEVVKRPVEAAAGKDYIESDDYYKQMQWNPFGGYPCFEIKQLELSLILQGKSSNHMGYSTVWQVSRGGLNLIGRFGIHYIESKDEYVAMLISDIDGSHTYSLGIRSPRLQANALSADPDQWPIGTKVEITAGSAGNVNPDIVLLLKSLI